MTFLLYLGLGAAAYYVVTNATSGFDCYSELPPAERELVSLALAAMEPENETELDRGAVTQLAAILDARGFHQSATCLRRDLSRSAA